jgi:hypothetical protein
MALNYKLKCDICKKYFIPENAMQKKCRACRNVSK